MPYDPTKPANNSPLSSLEMRAQLQSLNLEIQARATVTQMTMADNAVLQQSSANSNNVDLLSQSADSSYNQTQIQQILDKLDELITALRRL